MLKMLFCWPEHTLFEHDGDVPTSCADLILVSEDTNLTQEAKVGTLGNIVLRRVGQSHGRRGMVPGMWAVWDTKWTYYVS